MSKLEADLQKTVRSLIREFVGGDEWKSGERWLDALVSAVRAAVKLGEGRTIPS